MWALPMGAGRPPPPVELRRAHLRRRKSPTKAEVHKALSASRRAESRYVLDLARIVGGIHRGVLGILDREVFLSVERRDADDEAKLLRDRARRILSPRLVSHLVTHARTHVGAAFDTMASTVTKGATAGASVALHRSSYYDYEHREVPIADIVFPGGERGVPPVWEPAKQEFHAARLRAGEPSLPVDLTTVGTAGELRLINGIHRAAAAIEAGHTHIPAIIQHPKGTLRRRAGAQAETLLGFNLEDLGIRRHINLVRERNIQLVENAARSYAEQVREVFEDPKHYGLRVDELRDLVRARGEVSVARATLIARDQTLKLNASIAETRMRAAGVEEYSWSTSRDERVRPMHAELEGQRFRFDDPPVTNRAGDTNNPGQDYQCRCVALPVFAELELLDQPSDEDVAAE